MSKTMVATTALVVGVLVGCASPAPPETEAGGEVPFGYVLHCIEKPDSRFCEDDDDGE